MYNTLRPDGKPRPVIDLEGHYESTHHAFDVSARKVTSPTGAREKLIRERNSMIQPARPVWGGSDIRNGAYQAASLEMSFSYGTTTADDCIHSSS
jgi:hypothetical protein